MKEEFILMAWLQQYASMIAFFGQLAFWVVVGASAIWAATTFHQYVKYMTSDEEVTSTDVLAAEEDDTPVDDFVE
jgi:hypothetical protein